MYDAMKEKSQLINLLVRFRSREVPFCTDSYQPIVIKDSKHQDAGGFLDLHPDALDEELIELNNYISMHKPALTSIEEQEEETQSAEGQTEVGKCNYSVLD